MLTIRRAEQADVPRIHDLASRYEFAIPEKFHTASVVAHDSGQVCAFGLIRPILEAVIVTSGTAREVIEQTEILLGQGIMDAQMLGDNQIHAFVTDPVFAKLLKKKWGFKNPVGEPLVLVLE